MYNLCPAQDTPPFVQRSLTWGMGKVEIVTEVNEREEAQIERIRK